jgi:hypothetical protein
MTNKMLTQFDFPLQLKLVTWSEHHRFVQSANDTGTVNSSNLW